MNEELKTILTKFSQSGWELIETPAKEYLSGIDNKSSLIEAIEQANEQCGNCGCEFDPLYKRALTLLCTL